MTDLQTTDDQTTNQSAPQTTSALPFQPGDRVTHSCEPDLCGVIVRIDGGWCWNTYEVTTCEVQWDDCAPGDLDIQWTNKLEALSHAE